jgi:CHASE3 domain sensor protein
MVTKEQEAAWIAGVGISGDAMMQIAFKWLRDKERQRESRYNKTFAHVERTYYATVAAVIVGVVSILVGVVGIIVTLRH